MTTDGDAVDVATSEVPYVFRHPHALREMTPLGFTFPVDSVPPMRAWLTLAEAAQHGLSTVLLIQPRMDASGAPLRADALREHDTTRPTNRVLVNSARTLRGAADLFADYFTRLGNVQYLFYEHVKEAQRLHDSAPPAAAAADSGSWNRFHKQCQRIRDATNDLFTPYYLGGTAVMAFGIRAAVPQLDDPASAATKYAIKELMTTCNEIMEEIVDFSGIFPRGAAGPRWDTKANQDHARVYMLRLSTTAAADESKTTVPFRASGADADDVAYLSTSQRVCFSRLFSGWTRHVAAEYRKTVFETPTRFADPPRQKNSLWLVQFQKLLQAQERGPLTKKKNVRDEFTSVRYGFDGTLVPRYGVLLRNLVGTRLNQGAALRRFVSCAAMVAVLSNMPRGSLYLVESAGDLYESFRAWNVIPTNSMIWPWTFDNLMEKWRRWNTDDPASKRELTTRLNDKLLVHKDGWDVAATTDTTRAAVQQDVWSILHRTETHSGMMAFLFGLGRFANPSTGRADAHGYTAFLKHILRIRAHASDISEAIATREIANRVENPLLLDMLTPAEREIRTELHRNLVILEDRGSAPILEWGFRSFVSLVALVVLDPDKDVRREFPFIHTPLTTERQWSYSPLVAEENDLSSSSSSSSSEEETTTRRRERPVAPPSSSNVLPKRRRGGHPSAAVQAVPVVPFSAPGAVVSTWALMARSVQLAGAPSSSSSSAGAAIPARLPEEEGGTGIPRPGEDYEEEEDDGRPPPATAVIVQQQFPSWEDLPSDDLPWRDSVLEEQRLGVGGVVHPTPPPPAERVPGNDDDKDERPRLVMGDAPTYGDIEDAVGQFITQGSASSAAEPTGRSSSLAGGERGVDRLSTPGRTTPSSSSSLPARPRRRARPNTPPSLPEEEEDVMYAIERLLAPIAPGGQEPPVALPAVAASSPPPDEEHHGDAGASSPWRRIALSPGQRDRDPYEDDFVEYPLPEGSRDPFDLE